MITIRVLTLKCFGYRELERLVINSLKDQRIDRLYQKYLLDEVIFEWIEGS